MNRCLACTEPSRGRAITSWENLSTNDLAKHSNFSVSRLSQQGTNDETPQRRRQRLQICGICRMLKKVALSGPKRVSSAFLDDYGGWWTAVMSRDGQRTSLMISLLNQMLIVKGFRDARLNVSRFTFISEFNISQHLSQHTEWPPFWSRLQSSSTSETTTNKRSLFCYAWSHA